MVDRPREGGRPDRRPTSGRAVGVAYAGQWVIARGWSSTGGGHSCGRMRQGNARELRWRCGQSQYVSVGRRPVGERAGGWVESRHFSPGMAEQGLAAVDVGASHCPDAAGGAKAVMPCGDPDRGRISSTQHLFPQATLLHGRYPATTVSHAPYPAFSSPPPPFLELCIHTISGNNVVVVSGRSMS